MMKGTMLLRSFPAKSGLSIQSVLTISDGRVLDVTGPREDA